MGSQGSVNFKMQKRVAIFPLIISLLLLLGCAKETINKEKQWIEETVIHPILEITVVPIYQEGTIIKLKGQAFILTKEKRPFKRLDKGDIIPFGQIFYLEPKTIIEINQQDSENVYIYSKEKKIWFKLERKQ